MGKLQPHALVIPFPAQGHVIPLLELSHCLVDRGFKITFVTTEVSFDKITSTLQAEKVEQSDHDHIKMVAIPDGMGPEEDRAEHGKLCQSILAHMPGYLEELVRETNESEGEKIITCIVADGTMGWAVDVARKVGIPAVTMWPAAAAAHVFFDVVGPKLMADNIFDDEGAVANHQMIEIVAGLTMSTRDLVWLRMPPHLQQPIFNYVMSSSKSANKADYFLCNSFPHLEPAVFDHHPRLLPIGPLLPATRPGRAVGRFWPEDTSCLQWLDHQPPCSVVYVAFGSFTMLNKGQFQELARGLELCGRPFLWVVRPDLMMDGSTGAYPDGFPERVAGRGKVVSWAPQQKVLAHPSIACFMTHCGWNSTMEGLVNGVPFLCWPYFADQFFNKMYVCDVWRVGVGLEHGEDGVVTGEEVKNKLEAVLGDEGIRARAAKLREAATTNVARASKNLDVLVEKLLSLIKT